MNRGAVLWVVVAVLVVAGLVTFVVLSSAPPSGPVEPVWDRTSCAWCRMHVGEPRFAAQLHTADGDVLFFDDPGCLFELEAAQRPPVHATWFHGLREERWLRAGDVAFVPVEHSPMGYGLGAVARGTPGAIDLPAARAKALAGGESAPATQEGR